MSYTKKSTRSNYRSKRYSYSRSHQSFSSNKFRSKTNFAQMHEKYVNLAKEAASVGDRIQSEYYNQFADHYSRIMIENGIKSYEKENSRDLTENKQTTEDNFIKTSQENNQIKIETDENKKKNDEDSKDLIESSPNSIEEVSFISEPAKKSTKPKK